MAHVKPLTVRLDTLVQQTFEQEALLQEQQLLPPVYLKLFQHLGFLSLFCDHAQGRPAV